jgi:hypothetical protein
VGSRRRDQNGAERCGSECRSVEQCWDAGQHLRGLLSLSEAKAKHCAATPVANDMQLFSTRLGGT